MSKKANRRTILKTVGAFGATAAVAGCSGGGESGDSGTDGESNENNGTDDDSSGDEMGADDVAGDVTVALADTAFDPMRADISPGETVAWVNEDDTAHDVTATQFSDVGTEWSFNEDLSAGAATSYTFSESGVYEYYCTIHGETEMCGVVVVGDPDQVRPLPCMDATQLREQLDEYTLLAAERPYGIDISYDGVTSGETIIQEDDSGRRRMEITSTLRGTTRSAELYIEGDTVYWVFQGSCFPVPLGETPSYASEDQADSVEQFDELSKYERIEQFRSSLVFEETTTIDGAQAWVFSMSPEVYNQIYSVEAASQFEILDLQFTIRRDTYHLVRQQLSYTTAQGQVNMEIRYYAFGDPFDITIPCQTA